MGNLLSQNRLMTVALTIAALAAIYRIGPARDALTGDSKFLGIF